MAHEQQEKLFPSVELLPGKVFYHDKLCILDIETFSHHHQIALDWNGATSLDKMCHVISV